MHALNSRTGTSAHDLHLHVSWSLCIFELPITVSVCLWIPLCMILGCDPGSFMDSFSAFTVYEPGFGFWLLCCVQTYCSMCMTLAPDHSVIFSPTDHLCMTSAWLLTSTLLQFFTADHILHRYCLQQNVSLPPAATLNLFFHSVSSCSCWDPHLPAWNLPCWSPSIAATSDLVSQHPCPLVPCTPSHHLQGCLDQSLKGSSLHFSKLKKWRVMDWPI